MDHMQHAGVQDEEQETTDRNSRDNHEGHHQDASVTYAAERLARWNEGATRGWSAWCGKRRLAVAGLMLTEEK